MAKNIRAQFPSLFSIAETLIIACTFAAPLFFLPTLFDYSATKGFFIIGIAILALACMGTLWLSDRSYLPRLSKLWIPIGAYFLWIIITSIAGANPSVSFWSTFQLGTGILLFAAVLILAVCLAAVLEKKDIRSSLAKAVAWSGLIVVVIKYFTIGSTGKDLTGNVLYAGGFLLFAIAACLYLAAKSQKASRIWWVIVSIIIATCPYYLNLFGSHAGIASYLGDARAAAISLVVGIFAGALIWLSFSGKKVVRIASIALFVAAFAGAGIAAVSFFHDNSKLQSAYVKAASATRLLYGSIALEGIAEHPLIGNGWETFPLVYQKYYDPANLSDRYLGEGWVDKPHNVLLEVGSAAGLPGLALYLIMYGTILLACIIAVRKNYCDRMTGAIFFGLFLAYLLQNLFLYEVPVTQLMFYLSAAWILAYFPTEQRSDTRPLINETMIRQASVAFVWIAAIGGIIYFSILPAHENARIVAMKKLSVEERIDQSAKVFDISPMGSYDEFTVINDYADGYMKQLPNISTDGRALIQKELATYLTRMQADIEHSKVQYLKMYYAASAIADAMYAYAPNGKKDSQLLASALKYSLEEIRISPRDQAGYWQAAQVYLSAGRYDEAIRYAQMAVDLEPTVGQAQEVLMRIIFISGDKELLAKKIKEARKAIPGYDFYQ
jgi:O-antigen ligase